jgi:hypothetical protein
MSKHGRARVDAEYFCETRLLAELPLGTEMDVKGQFTCCVGNSPSGGATLKSLNSSANAVDESF